MSTNSPYVIIILNDKFDDKCMYFGFGTFSLLQMITICSDTEIVHKCIGKIISPMVYM